MADIHYLGEFPTFNAVWKKFPNGGGYGDYVTILGVRYDWDESKNSWGDDPGDVDPALPEVVNHDIDVQGTVTARDGVKTADYIPGEVGAFIDHAGDAEFRSVNVDALWVKDPVTGEQMSLPDFIKVFKTELPPDWADYEQIIQFDNVRILAFDPLSQDKFYTTIGALKKLISDSIAAGSTGGGTFDIEILRSDDPEGIPTDNNVFSSLKTILTIQAALGPVIGQYLSRLNPDEAQGLIKFLAGAEFGEFLSGILGGKGARIDELGNIEATSLALRGFLSAPEYRFNRITFVGDETIFSDMGTIEEVELLEGKLYRLTMRLEEGDNLTFKVGDLVKGIYHYNTYGFSTSYMRVESIIDEYMDVLLVDNEDTPTLSNYPPTKFMKIARVGYAGIDFPERSRYVVASSKAGGIQVWDGCVDFLSGRIVASMDLSQAFKSQYGPLPTKEGLPYLYAAGIVTEHIIRVDYEGVPVREINDRGPWKAGVIYYNNDDNGTDDVWHLGVRWRCFASSTTEEPSWTSADWVNIEGRPNMMVVIEQYYISTSSSELVGGVWTEEIPTWEEGKYIYSRSKILYQDGSETFTDPVYVPILNGKSVTKIDVEYATSSSRQIAPTEGWQTTDPGVQPGEYLWSRTIVYYSDGTHEIFGEACISGNDGEPGKDGVAPIIIDGFWAFWDEDTQTFIKSTFSAIGDDGHSPYVDELTGTWFEWDPNINNWRDTGIKAEGDTGADGYSVSLSKAEHTFNYDKNGNLKGVLSDGTISVEVLNGANPLICDSLAVSPPTLDGSYRVTNISISPSTTLSYNVDRQNNIFRIIPTQIDAEEVMVTFTIVARTNGVNTTFTRQLKYQKSHDGADGVAPIIIDGFWAFWNDTLQDYVKSSFSAVGDDGHSPYVGANGNWYQWVPESGTYEDTGIKAEGDPGEDGYSVSLSKSEHTFNYDKNGNLKGLLSDGVVLVEVMKGPNALMCDSLGVLSPTDNHTYRVTAITQNPASSFSYNVDRPNNVFRLIPVDMTVDEVELTFTIVARTNDNNTTFTRKIRYQKHKDGADGTDGTDGDGVVHIYKQYPTKPSTPSSGVANPTGWSRNPDYILSIVSQTNWTVNGIWHQSEELTATGNSATSRITFTTYKDAQTITLELWADGHATYDYVYAGKLDTAASTSNYYDRVRGGKIIITYDVPTAGSHYIDIFWRKGISTIVGSNRGYYAIISDVKVWRSTTNVIGGVVQTWSEPQQFDIDTALEERIYCLSKTTTAPAISDSDAHINDYIPLPCSLSSYRGDFTTNRAYSIGQVVRYQLEYYKVVKAIWSSSTRYPTDEEYFEKIPGWTDNPVGANKDYPFEFVAIRRKQIDGLWGDWTASVWSNYGIGTNYIHMGWWNPSITYYKTELGIPLVKKEDGTGYSAYTLKVAASTPGSFILSEWDLVETADFIYMEQAYIERLQAQLISAVTVELKEDSSPNVTAGISGIQGAQKTLPTFWAGGTYAEAISGTAKAIIKHNGKAIFEDAEIRGEINAILGEIGDLKIIDSKLKSQDGRLEIDGVNRSITLRDANMDVKTIIHPDVIPSIDSFFESGSANSVSLSSLNGTITTQKTAGLTVGGLSSDTVELTISAFTIRTVIGVSSTAYEDASVEAYTKAYLNKNGTFYMDLGSNDGVGYKDSPYDETMTISAKTISVSGNATYTLTVEHGYRAQGDPSASTYGVISGFGTMSTGKVIDRSEIGVNGMVIATSPQSYTYMVGDTFQVRRGNTFLRVTANGIEKSINGTTWTLI